MGKLKTTGQVFLRDQKGDLWLFINFNIFINTVTLWLNAKSRISSIYDHRTVMKKVQVAFRETSWEQQFIMKSSRQNREQQIQQRGFNRGPSITRTLCLFHIRVWKRGWVMKSAFTSCLPALLLICINKLRICISLHQLGSCLDCSTVTWSCLICLISAQELTLNSAALAPSTAVCHISIPKKCELVMNVNRTDLHWSDTLSFDVLFVLVNNWADNADWTWEDLITWNVPDPSANCTVLYETLLESHCWEQCQHHSWNQQYQQIMDIKQV